MGKDLEGNSESSMITVELGADSGVEGSGKRLSEGVRCLWRGRDWTQVNIEEMCVHRCALTHTYVHTHSARTRQKSR